LSYEYSCDKECEKNRNCCYDYNRCSLIPSFKVEDTTSKCKTKKLNSEECIECRENFYLNVNECVEKCPVGTEAVEKNKICRTKICTQQNCERCRENQCRKCYSGSFLFEGKCVDKCPIGFRADRKSWSCKIKEGKLINKIHKILSSDLSFYSVVPSSYDCSNQCGTNTNADCSCEFTCLQRGTCCENFMSACTAESLKEKCLLCNECDSQGKCLKCKRNASLKDGTCQCLSTHTHNKVDDICVWRVDEINKLAQNLNTTTAVKSIKKVSNPSDDKNSTVRGVYSNDTEDISTTQVDSSKSDKVVSITIITNTDNKINSNVTSSNPNNSSLLNSNPSAIANSTTLSLASKTTSQINATSTTSTIPNTTNKIQNNTGSAIIQTTDSKIQSGNVTKQSGTPSTQLVSSTSQIGTTIIKSSTDQSTSLTLNTTTTTTQNASSIIKIGNSTVQSTTSTKQSGSTTDKIISSISTPSLSDPSSKGDSKGKLDSSKLPLTQATELDKIKSNLNNTVTSLIDPKTKSVGPDNLAIQIIDPEEEKLTIQQAAISKIAEISSIANKSDNKIENIVNPKTDNFIKKPKTGGNKISNLNILIGNKNVKINNQKIDN